MISFKPLWKTLLDKGMKKTDLLAAADISRGTLAKLSKDQYVSLKVIDSICENLDVAIDQVIEFKHGDCT